MNAKVHCLGFDTADGRPRKFLALFATTENGVSFHCNLSASDVDFLASSIKEAMREYHEAMGRDPKVGE